MTASALRQNSSNSAHYRHLLLRMNAATGVFLFLFCFFFHPGQVNSTLMSEFLKINLREILGFENHKFAHCNL